MDCSVGRRRNLQWHIANLKRLQEAQEEGRSQQDARKRVRVEVRASGAKEQSRFSQSRSEFVLREFFI